MSTSAVTGAAKKKRQSGDNLNSRKSGQPLSISDRLMVLKRLDRGEKQSKIVQELGLSKSQVSRIYCDRVKLKKIEQDKSVPLKSKLALAKAKHPELDDAIFKWFVHIQHPSGKCKPLPLTRDLIKKRALQEGKRLNINDFRASDGWFRNWRWRLGIGKSVRLHGEAGDVNLEEAEQEMSALRQRLKDGGYKEDNIFNMDETGLFYRCLPNRSYVFNATDVRQHGKGTKAMQAKDRISLVFCVNATGTCKVDPLIIGTAKTPHCFRGQKCPLPYIDQARGWVDKPRYRHWWFNVFLPAIRNHTEDKVALLMDSCSGRDKECIDPTGQVDCFYFPVNTTSIFQPLDQGIISVIKTRYKSLMLAKMVAASDNYEELQRIAQTAGNGRRGLKYGCPAHVMDAAILIDECWKELPETTITGCWRRAKCLPEFESPAAISDNENQSLEDLERNAQDAAVEICQLIAGKLLDFFLYLYLQ